MRPLFLDSWLSCLLMGNRVSELFLFHLTGNTLEHAQSVPLTGNALSVVSGIPVSDGAPRQLFVSVDGIHKAGSTTEVRDVSEEADNIEIFFIKDGVLSKHSSMKAVEGRDVTDGTLNGLRNLLYSLENLRKRDGEESAKDMEAVEEVTIRKDVSVDAQELDHGGE